MDKNKIDLDNINKFKKRINKNRFRKIFILVYIIIGSIDLVTKNYQRASSISQIISMYTILIPFFSFIIYCVYVTTTLAETRLLKKIIRQEKKADERRV